MPTARWFFKNARSDETFIYEGNPENIPSFQGWVSVRKQTGTKKVKTANGKFIYKEPTILHKGLLYVGRLLNVAVGGGPCSPNCRRATQPYCKCSCHGKNHGVENRDMVNAIQEEDVIYLG